MEEFYLQEGRTESEVRAYKKGDNLTPADKRVFLDSRIHVGLNKRPNKVLQTIHAESWIQARAKAIYY